jgi:hypothetical protein
MSNMGNTDPETGNSYPEYSCDWGNGLKCVFFDGKNILTHSPKRVSDFLLTHSPCVIYIESAFESYDNSLYNDTLTLASHLNSKIYTISSRKTDRLRRDKKLDKTDETDAILIWEIAHSGYHLKVPRPRSIKRTSRLEKANNDRRAFGYTSSNPSWSEVKSYLPEYLSQPDWLKDVLGDGKTYASGFVTPIAQAALEVLDNGGNRTSFDKLLGTYAHGYPSYQRAAIFNKANGRVSSLVRRDIKNGLDEKESLKIRLKQVRKATRIIYGCVAKQYSGNNHPAMGKENPIL